MPDSTPARLSPAEALENALATLFGRLRTQPAPDALLSLVDQLEAAHQQSVVAKERRTIG